MIGVIEGPTGCSKTVWLMWGIQGGEQPALSLAPGDPPRPLGGLGCRGHRELEGHGDAVHRRVLPLEGQSSGSGETPGTLGMGSGPQAPVTLLKPVDCAPSVFSSSGW